MDPHTLTVMSLDPGTTTTGVAILSANHQGVSQIDFAETINGEQLARRLKDVVHIHGLRFAKITAIANHIQHLLQLYQPDVIFSEAPFYNPRMPQAYGPLVEVVSMLRSVVYRHNPSLKVIMIDPSTVKKSMGVSGGSSDKSLMSKALHTRGLLYDSHLIPAMFDEHTVDAISVGLCGIVEYYIK